MIKWIRSIFCTVVRKELGPVVVHVVHPYRSVPIYSMTWQETVYVNDVVLTTTIRESHTAMAMGKQYTHSDYASLANEINSLLAR